ncbi:MAG TPA: hypothetical protein VJ986_03565 [Gaiellaceae bacterium]|nr:hypothetical protein [Gaiellaceae bacterium]
MLDLDQLLLCEHDREPGECPICAEDEAERSIFDPYAWAEAYAATTRLAEPEPSELVGAPTG